MWTPDWNAGCIQTSCCFRFWTILPKIRWSKQRDSWKILDYWWRHLIFQHIVKSHPELTNTTWSNVIDRSFSPRHICFTGPTSQTHPGADFSKYFCLFASAAPESDDREQSPSVLTVWVPTARPVGLHDLFIFVILCSASLCCCDLQL